MPERTRHLGYRRMAEMAGGVEKIRARAGEDWAEIRRRNPVRLKALRRVTSRSGW